ncbi:MAG: transposase [Fuerstiella sp.]
MLDCLAEFTQHIPDKGSHLTRYYGWYSNKSRGVRKKAEILASAAAGESSSEDAAPPRSNSTWAMLIKRIYEADPLICPQCGGQMKVVAFIKPPQSEVIEKILRHCGLLPIRFVCRCRIAKSFSLSRSVFGCMPASIASCYVNSLRVPGRALSPKPDACLAATMSFPG